MCAGNSSSPFLGDAAAVEMLPRLDIRRDGQTIDSSQRATSVALRALRMACETEPRKLSPMLSRHRVHTTGQSAGSMPRGGGSTVWMRAAGSEPAKAMFLSRPAQTASDCNRIRAAASGCVEPQERVAPVFEFLKRISMSSPVESSSVQFNRGLADAGSPR